MLKQAFLDVLEIKIFFANHDGQTFKEIFLKFFLWTLHFGGGISSLRNSGVKYGGNKMPSLGNTSAKSTAAEDSAETFVYYVGNGFGIRRNFTEGYDLFFFLTVEATCSS